MPTGDETDEERRFLERLDRSLATLFARARQTSAAQFAAALDPARRAADGSGFSAADEAIFAVEDYLAFLTSAPPSRGRVRIALGFYSQLAGAPGLYEVPKNMLRVVEGLPAMSRPFDHVVTAHRDAGGAIAGEASSVIRDLVGHASALGLAELAGVFGDAFDPKVSNGYAQALYVVEEDGLKFPGGPGEASYDLSVQEFERLLHRGLGFFARLFQITHEQGPALSVTGE
jgi:hypothetical protein